MLAAESLLTPKLEVEEGSLVCQESGREFPIKNGIPDMLLKENEVK